MDTKLIQQYGQEILSYRLRTARQKKRMRYEDFDKYLIALSKEETVLYRHKHNPEWEPLTPPVQRGWKRFFVLRDDVVKSRHAEFFENILKKINTYDWSYRKDFKIKKRRFGRKTHVVKDQQLAKPDEYHFKRLEFTEKEKQFFHPEYSYQKGSGKFIKRYVFNEPWRFVLRIRPNMIDKTRKIDAEKESRLKEIQNYLVANDLKKRTRKILFGYYQHMTWGRPDKENPFNNKSFNEVLYLINQEVL